MTWTFKDYLERVTRELLRHSDWRVGQTYYNVLYTVRFDLVGHVDKRPAVDPFYDDGNLTAFIAFVRGAWSKPVELVDQERAEQCAGVGRDAIPGTGRPICPICHRGPTSIGITARVWRRGITVPPHKADPQALRSTP